MFIITVMLPAALQLFTEINITSVTGGGSEYTTLITAWPYIGVAVVAGIIVYFVFAAFRK